MNCAPPIFSKWGWVYEEVWSIVAACCGYGGVCGLHK